MQNVKPLPPLTDLERARLETCAARRQMIAANRTALALMETANERDEREIIDAAIARGSVPVAPPAGDAEVVELRPGGPVAA